MVSFVAKGKIFRFWPKTMDYIIIIRRFTKIEVIFCGHSTLQWKVL